MILASVSTTSCVNPDVAGLGLCRRRAGRTRRTGDRDRRTWIETLQQHKGKGADLCTEGCSATGKGCKRWKVEGPWYRRG